MSNRHDTADARWAAALCHPLPLGVTLLLALNDHWLKHCAWFPRAVAGKLSDICGLFVLPIVVMCIARGSGALVGRRLPSRVRWGVMVLALVGTAVGFSASILDPRFNAWLARSWGPKVMDPSDLWTMPMLMLSALWLVRAERGPSRAEAS